MTVRWTVRAADRALRRVQVLREAKRPKRKRNGENYWFAESLNRGKNQRRSARIPLQSPPSGGDSFPPGEATAAAPPKGAKPKKNALRIRGARYIYLLQLFGDEVQRQLIQLRFHTGEIHAGGK